MIPTSYTYDGRRIQQRGAKFVWDELSRYGDVIYESTGSDTTTYTLGAGHLISQKKNNSTSYFLRDGQHSTRALLSPAAAITQTFSYTPYGELINTDGSLIQNPAPATRYLYTGQQFDAATNLYSLRARYYDPSDGRFLSRDTWAYNFQNPVELNRYGYVAANPVNWGDPSGHMLVEQKQTSNISITFRQAIWKYIRNEPKEILWEGFWGGLFSLAGYSVAAALYKELAADTGAPMPLAQDVVNGGIRAFINGAGIAMSVKILGGALNEYLPSLSRDALKFRRSDFKGAYQQLKGLGYNYQDIKKGLHVTQRSNLFSSGLIMSFTMGGFINEFSPYIEAAAKGVFGLGPTVDLHEVVNQIKNDIEHHGAIIALYVLSGLLQRPIDADVVGKSTARFVSFFAEGVVSFADSLPARMWD